MTQLLHELPLGSAQVRPQATALRHGETSLRYGDFARDIRACAAGLIELGLGRQERVAIYLEKRFENVIAVFGTTAAGGVFVPINPLLKAEQVGYILRDCDVRILVTSPERYEVLADTLPQCPDLRHVVLTEDAAAQSSRSTTAGHALHRWAELLRDMDSRAVRVIDSDMAAILYTSGSTGRPKGVVLSHRNMVAGAKSVASYLENTADDVLLAALPLSFDAGFSQLTTAFHVGACAVLLNYLLPRDVVNALERARRIFRVSRGMRPPVLAM